MDSILFRARGLAGLALLLSTAAAFSGTARAADYAVNTSGSSPDITLTVTNTNNNGDTIGVQPQNSNANTIEFFASGRTFSVNGAPATGGGSGSSSLLAVVSSTITNNTSTVIFTETAGAGDESLTEFRFGS